MPDIIISTVIMEVDHTISGGRCDTQLESNKSDAVDGNSSSPDHMISTTGTLGKGRILNDIFP